MADRIIVIKATCKADGEKAVWSYNADTKTLTANPNAHVKIEIVSDS